MAGTSAGMPVTGSPQPMTSGPIIIEVDATGLGPLKPAPVSPRPAAANSVSHVQMSTADLFVQYHEYFQKLHLDMQVHDHPRVSQAWTSAPAPPTAQPPDAPLISVCCFCSNAAHERGDRAAPDSVGFKGTGTYRSQRPVLRRHRTHHRAEGQAAGYHRC